MEHQIYNLLYFRSDSFTDLPVYYRLIGEPVSMNARGDAIFGFCS